MQVSTLTHPIGGQDQSNFELLEFDFTIFWFRLVSLCFFRLVWFRFASYFQFFASKRNMRKTSFFSLRSETILAYFSLRFALTENERRTLVFIIYSKKTLS
jgi:hypothetical protein